MIPKISNFIQSSKICQNVGKKISSIPDKIGGALENSSHKDTFNKILKRIEPTGANNAFIPMASLMVGTVIAPRVLTAAKRNPDDKEATKDEIKEILFRDVQTVLIVLFALKAMNSIIAGKTSKISGLPMTNKPYQKVFNSNEKGLKGIFEKGKEIIHNPKKKLKAVGKNILDTLNPTGGVITYTNDEFTSKYSNYNSIDEVVKMLDAISDPSQGGNGKKVFNKIIDSLIKQQEELINGNAKKGIKGLVQKAKMTADKNGNYTKLQAQELSNAKKLLAELNEIKEKGYNTLNDKETSEALKNTVVSFMQDEDNALLKDAKGLNAVLRTVALGIEAMYLGFGLPALNQKRLEKKYLKNNANKGISSSQNVSNSLISKNTKANEIKLFHNFIK